MMTYDIITEKDNNFELHLFQALKKFVDVHLPRRGDDDGEIALRDIIDYVNSKPCKIKLSY